MNLLTVGNNVEPITLRKLLETYSNRTTDSVTSCGGNSISSYIYMHCILVEGMSAVLIHRDISLRYLSLIRNGSEVNVIMLPSNASGQAFSGSFQCTVHLIALKDIERASHKGDFLEFPNRIGYY